MKHGQWEEANEYSDYTVLDREHSQTVGLWLSNFELCVKCADVYSCWCEGVTDFRMCGYLVIVCDYDITTLPVMKYSTVVCPIPLYLLHRMSTGLKECVGLLFFRSS